ncbi:helix-turn-helix domain-containing protein [Gammaproteobacteria bacterium]|nr:helix-turn-helix domain-containing protein [Gammaproteobacteria bacterium]
MPALAHFTVLLFDGFSNMVLASTLEPLRDVQRRSDAAIDWRICSIDGAAVRSSSGLTIQPDCRIDTAERDTLIVIVGYGARRYTQPLILKAIRQAARACRQVIAVDAGSWLLAAAGLLNGKRATIHWQSFDAFRETFPAVELSTARYIESGRIISAGGASTAMELILDVIARRFGELPAFEARTMFVYDPINQHRTGRGAIGAYAQMSPSIGRAVKTMAAHIERPLALTGVAAEANTSLRTLNRVFLNELGTTPGRYYRLLRLGVARDLVQETRLPLEDVALRTGFSSASVLSRAFREIYKLAPGAMRTSPRDP